MGNFLLTAIACCTSKNMSTHLIVPVNIQKKITPQSFDKGPDTLRRRVLSRGCCLPATDRPAPRPRVPAGQSSSLSPARPGQVRSGQARPGRGPPHSHLSSHPPTPFLRDNAGRRAGRAPASPKTGSGKPLFKGTEEKKK